MRRRISGGFVLLFVSAMVLLACASKATPAPTAAPTPSQPSSTAPATPSSISPEDSAWTKVVEAAKKEGRLTVYSVHLVGDVAIAVTQAFTKRTGLDLDIVAGQSTTLIERVKVERRMGSQVGDVHTGNSGLLLIAKQDGLTQKIGYLPELKDEGIRRYNPWIDTDEHVLAFSLQVSGPWVNTTLVRPGTEPRSWRDFLKPEWRGKIGMPDPATDPGGINVFYVLTSRGILEPAYFSDLRKQDLQFYSTSRMSATALARGEVPLSFAQSMSTVVAPLREGAPLKAIDMAEGVAMERNSVAALYQGAPHPNAARVFLNWFFSQEGQTVYAKINGSVSPRKDVPSFEPSQGLLNPTNPIFITEEDALKLVQILKQNTFGKLLGRQ